MNIQIFGCKKCNEIKSDNKDTVFQDECFEYMAEFAKLIYENEERREDSLLQQASHIQTAFSFVIAAVFMVMPTVIENRGPISLWLLLVIFSSITLVLLFCLFAATMAQNRVKREDFPNVKTIKFKITTEYENFLSKAQRSKYLVDTYEIMHESYAKTNDKRRMWVATSMKAFYFALALCVVWFIIIMCKVL